MYGLVESLRDNAEETFIKLGYSEIELNFNYPKATLLFLLGIDDESALVAALDGFFAENQELLSGSGYVIKKSSVRITLSKEAVKRFFLGYDENGFLSELYSALGAHGVTLADIEAVFDEHNKGAKCELFEGEDFDAVFACDADDDPYRYLFKFEDGHCDFHRLLESDFNEIYKNDN